MCSRMLSGICLHNMCQNNAYISVCLYIYWWVIKGPNDSRFSSLALYGEHIWCTSKGDISKSVWRNEVISITNKSLKTGVSRRGCFITLGPCIIELLWDQMVPDSHLLHYMENIFGALQRVTFQKLFEGTGWFQVPKKLEDWCINYSWLHYPRYK